MLFLNIKCYFSFQEPGLWFIGGGKQELRAPLKMKALPLVNFFSIKYVSVCLSSASLDCWVYLLPVLEIIAAETEWFSALTTG